MGVDWDMALGNFYECADSMRNGVYSDDMVLVVELTQGGLAVEAPRVRLVLVVAARAVPV